MDSMVEEAGTALAGTLDGLFHAPLLNLGVVAAEQDVGHLPSTELGGTCVFGRCHEAILE